MARMGGVFAVYQGKQAYQSLVQGLSEFQFGEE